MYPETKHRYPPIESERLNLILWARSSTLRSAGSATWIPTDTRESKRTRTPWTRRV